MAVLLLKRAICVYYLCGIICVIPFHCNVVLGMNVSDLKRGKAYSQTSSPCSKQFCLFITDWTGKEKKREKSPVFNHTELNTPESTQRSTVTPTTPSHCVPVLRLGAVCVCVYSPSVMFWVSVVSLLRPVFVRPHSHADFFFFNVKHHSPVYSILNIKAENLSN